jgi:N-acetyl-anhydromuramyl-L-alanine amidase AmpD
VSIIDDIDHASSAAPAIVGDASEIAEQLLHRAHAADSPLPLEFDDGGWAHGDGVTCFRKMPGVVGPTLVETLKQQGLAPGLEHCEGVVWHYTDTRACGAVALARRLLDPANKRAASWHACVDATGAISQSVSARCGSWHAGGSDAALFVREAPTSIPGSGGWRMLGANERGYARGYSANSWAFGIELENVGEVRLSEGRWCGWPFRFGTEYGAPVVVAEVEVVEVGGKHWHAFTDAQAAGATRLLAGLVARYGLLRSACTWTHHVIDPNNREDPGPAWAPMGRMDEVLRAVFGA